MLTTFEAAAKKERDLRGFPAKQCRAIWSTVQCQTGPHDAPQQVYSPQMLSLAWTLQNLGGSLTGFSRRVPTSAYSEEETLIGAACLPDTFRGHASVRGVGAPG